MNTIPNNGNECQGICLTLNIPRQRYAANLFINKTLYDPPLEEGNYEHRDVFPNPSRINQPNVTTFHPGIAAIPDNKGRIKLPINDLPGVCAGGLRNREFDILTPLKEVKDGLGRSHQAVENITIDLGLKLEEIPEAVLRPYLLLRIQKLALFGDCGPGSDLNKLTLSELIQEFKRYTQDLLWPRENLPLSQGDPQPDTQRPPARPGKPGLTIVPPTETRKTPETKPLTWSVGQKLKLFFIPDEFLSSKPFEGISRGALELYRIHRTFSKPEKTNFLNRYNTTGDNQLSGLMKKRKADLLHITRGDKRKEIERMGTSIRSVQRYNAELLRRGLVIPPYHGWEGKGVAKRLVCCSEAQVKWWWGLRNRVIRENREREAKRIAALKDRTRQLKALEVAFPFLGKLTL